MTDDTLDLAIAIPIAAACVLVSALCSSTEVALFSLRRVDRDQLGRSKAGGDRRIARMLERPRRLIATVLIGNEACTGVLASIALAVLLRWWSPWPAAGLALAIVLPIAVLVMEVTAKTLAAKSPLGWARACAPLLRGFSLVVAPVRVVITRTAELLLRPLGERARAKPARDLSEAEFRKLVDAGSAQGQVDARERRLIHRVFEFSDKNVGQVMTPRDRIYALSYDLPMQRIAREVANRGFSRVPIYQKSIDNVRGVINAKDLVSAAAGRPQAKPLADLLHEPLFVPRTTPIKRMFLTFKTKKVHMAIVVSEYGKVLGLVTMDDLLAQIFGVLRDERAALQSAGGGRGGKPRTPPTGVAPSRPGTDPPGDVARERLEPLEPSIGVPLQLGETTGPLPRQEQVALGDATGPVRMEDASGPVRRPDSDVTSEMLDPPRRPRHPTADPVPRDRATAPEIDTDTKLRALASSVDAVPPGLRPSAEHAIPLYPTDELTPPAIDPAELAATGTVEHADVDDAVSDTARRRR